MEALRHTMITSSGSQYLHPEYIQPLPTTVSVACLHFGTFTSVRVCSPLVFILGVLFVNSQNLSFLTFLIRDFLKIECKKWLNHVLSVKNYSFISLLDISATYTLPDDKVRHLFTNLE